MSAIGGLGEESAGRASATDRRHAEKIHAAPFGGFVLAQSERKARAAKLAITQRAHGQSRTGAHSLVFQRLCGSCMCNGAYHPLLCPACAAWDCKGRSQEAEVRSEGEEQLVRTFCSVFRALRSLLTAWVFLPDQKPLLAGQRCKPWAKPTGMARNKRLGLGGSERLPFKPCHCVVLQRVGLYRASPSRGCQRYGRADRTLRELRSRDPGRTGNGDLLHVGGQDVPLQRALRSQVRGAVLQFVQPCQLGLAEYEHHRHIRAHIQQPGSGAGWTSYHPDVTSLPVLARGRIAYGAGGPTSARPLSRDAEIHRGWKSLNSSLRPVRSPPAKPSSRP